VNHHPNPGLAAASTLVPSSADGGFCVWQCWQTQRIRPAEVPHPCTHRSQSGMSVKLGRLQYGDLPSTQSRNLTCNPTSTIDKALLFLCGFDMFAEDNSDFAASSHGCLVHEPVHKGSDLSTTEFALVPCVKDVFQQDNSQPSAEPNATTPLGYSLEL
jgi:hypothetical protein